MEPGAIATQPSERAPLPAPDEGTTNVQSAAVAVAGATTLERLDEAEKAIVDLFRRSTDEGKTVIHRVATTVPKVDD